MRVDLHTHTNRSDGVFSPSELVLLATEAGLDGVAIADHDSLAGLDEAEVAGARLGVEVIPAVELSVRDPGPASGGSTDEHLLALFVDRASSILQRYLGELQEGRVAMARETVERLGRLGVPVDPLRVAELAAGAVVTRPHIARALVEAGHVASEQEAFERYLGSGRPAAPERPAPTSQRAIDVATAAGGVVVLAHPVFVKDPGWQDRLAALPATLDRLGGLGLVGVECFYPDATPDVSERLERWTRERGLLPTGGTDYHGPGKAPYAPLGQVSVDGDVLERLRARRPAG